MLSNGRLKLQQLFLEVLAGILLFRHNLLRRHKVGLSLRRFKSGFAGAGLVHRLGTLHIVAPHLRALVKPEIVVVVQGAVVAELLRYTTTEGVDFTRDILGQALGVQHPRVVALFEQRLQGGALAVALVAQHALHGVAVTLLVVVVKLVLVGQYAVLRRPDVGVQIEAFALRYVLHVLHFLELVYLVVGHATPGHRLLFAGVRFGRPEAVIFQRVAAEVAVVVVRLFDRLVAAVEVLVLHLQLVLDGLICGYLLVLFVEVSGELLYVVADLLEALLRVGLLLQVDVVAEGLPVGRGLVLFLLNVIGELSLL